MGVCESTAAPVELDGSDLAGPKKDLTADAMDTDDQSQAVATSIEAEQRIISANRDGLIEVFMLLDQDQDGLVSCEELMRICVANSEAQELMSEYDQDGDEHISVDEWLQAAAGQDPQLIKDAIAMLAEAKQKDNWTIGYAIKYCDNNDELLEFVQHWLLEVMDTPDMITSECVYNPRTQMLATPLGLAIERQLPEVVQLLLDSGANVLQPHSCAIVDGESYLQHARNHRNKDIQLQIATAMFKQLDTNADGSLQISEFIPYLYGTQVEPLNEETRRRNEQEMAKIDTNGDGKVCLQEWIKFLQRQWLLARYKTAAS